MLCFSVLFCIHLFTHEITSLTLSLSSRYVCKCTLPSSSLACRTKVSHSITTHKTNLPPLHSKLGKSNKRPSISKLDDQLTNDEHHQQQEMGFHKQSLKRPWKMKNTTREQLGGRIVRSTGRKDRHSKVCTAKGPRDRRLRLSANIAIQFYDVQDRLGCDRPSKAIDWLMKKAKTAIDSLYDHEPENHKQGTTVEIEGNQQSHNGDRVSLISSQPLPNSNDFTNPILDLVVGENHSMFPQGGTLQSSYPFLGFAPISPQLSNLSLDFDGTFFINDILYDF